MIQTNVATTGTVLSKIEMTAIRLFLSICRLSFRRLSHADRIEALLVQGQRAILCGNTLLASWSFWRVTRLDSSNQEAWVSLASIVDSHTERERYLRHALAINPYSRQGRYAAELLEEGGRRADTL